MNNSDLEMIDITNKYTKYYCYCAGCDNKIRYHIISAEIMSQCNVCYDMFCENCIDKKIVEKRRFGLILCKRCKLDGFLIIDTKKNIRDSNNKYSKIYIEKL